jgi:uncharacterized protein YcsI (UPF0317 family)
MHEYREEHQMIEQARTTGDRETGRDVRIAARGGFTGLTVGRARGYRQANLVVIPADLSAEFLGFCRANPKSLPLLGYSEQGSAALDGLGADIDVRTDLPSYDVYRNGVREQVTDIRELWRDDFVAIAIGCWFGAEGALAEAGIRMRHVELGIQGSLFRSNLESVHYGRFDSTLVVSMRPFLTTDTERVAEITARLPLSHGAPLPFTSPAELGIDHLDSPDWGETLIPEAGEVPLFFGCGLTSTAALLDAGVEYFITHSAGSMLVTDELELLPAAS